MSLEVKCPFTLKDLKITEAVENGAKIGLRKSTDGTWKLDVKHKYFYQVQLQLFVAQLKFADFVMWSPSEMYIERVELDASFVTRNVAKAKELCVTAILPELLGKYFSRPKIASTSSGDKLYCYCRVQLSDTLVLVCASEACLYQRFHMKCCRLSRRPHNKE